MPSSTAERTEYRVETRGVALGWRPIGVPLEERRLAERELERQRDAYPSQSYRITERTVFIQRSAWRVV